MERRSQRVIGGWLKTEPGKAGQTVWCERGRLGNGLARLAGEPESVILEAQRDMVSSSKR